jgi:hypothetical protein
MRTWIVIFKTGDKLGSMLITTENFEEAIRKFLKFSENAELKGIFEVAI